MKELEISRIPQLSFEVTEALNSCGSTWAFVETRSRPLW